MYWSASQRPIDMPLGYQLAATAAVQSYSRLSFLHYMYLYPHVQSNPILVRLANLPRSHKIVDGVKHDYRLRISTSRRIACWHTLYVDNVYSIRNPDQLCTLRVVEDEDVREPRYTTYIYAYTGWLGGSREMCLEVLSRT